MTRGTLIVGHRAAAVTIRANHSAGAANLRGRGPRGVRPQQRLYDLIREVVRVHVAFPDSPLL